MYQRFLSILLLILVLALTACSASGTITTVGATQQQTTNNTTAQTSGSTTEASQPVSTAAASAAEVLAENSEVHEDAEDYVWDTASITSIALNGDSITVEGDGVTVDGSKATITSAGTYSISGSLSDGQVVVNTTDKEVVRLILNGANIQSSTSAPIYIKDAKETMIVLAENTQNTLSDGTSYVFDVPAEEEPNAAIFSKSDLTFYGTGSLTVNANFNDGISSKDGLLITSGAITVNAADDGIRGKDYLVVKDGAIAVSAQGDGLKSDNAEDAARGYISIEKGAIQVTSAGDAINAETDVTVTGGEITLTTGGGSSSGSGEISAKGIKGVVSVNIDGGTFTIDSADDAIHSNGSVVVNNGTFVIASGDDGMHADATLTINNGDIQINGSYEGIESAVITINAGNIHVKASDDGINVAGGIDGSGMGGMRGPGQDAFNYSGSYYLYIHGGTIAVDAAGDGIDVGGAIEMTDGVVLVNGPTEQMNGPLDYDGGFTMTGGFLVAAGSSGMAQAPGQNSSQNAVMIFFNATQPAGTLVHIQNSAGEDILTFAPTKSYQSLAFSSPELVQGQTYEISTGGSVSGTATDGLYQDGAYTAGTSYTSFTVSSVVTTVGSGGMGGGGMRGGGGRRP